MMVDVSLRRVVSQMGLLLLALVVGLAIPARAQTGGGVIGGTITDAQGGVLPGVTLTLRNTETGVIRTTVSEGDGRYRFAALPPGTYEVKAELPGFATVGVKNLTLTIGLELKGDVTMKIQSLEETVTVTGQSAVVETTKSDVSAVVTQRQIDTLPVNSRQALGLAILLPGTSQDAVRSRKVNTTVGAGGTWYSSGFVVDGVTNRESAQYEPRQNFPQAAIREFRVNVSQFSAENGGGTGGMVAIVTKGGTNLWSGEAFEYFRDKSLNAMNIIEQQQHDQLGVPKPDFRRHQYGASFGGPIVKDRAHFFVSADATKTDEFITVNTGKPEFYSALEGSFLNDKWRNLFFIREDTQVSPKHTLFVRWGWEHDHQSCLTCGGITSAFSASGTENPRFSLVVGHTWVMSSGMLNELRFQWAKFSQLSAAPGAPFWTKRLDFPPERMKYLTQQFTFPSLRWGSDSTNVSDEEFWEVRDGFSINADWHGVHTLKFGAGYLNIPIHEEVLPSLGAWTFRADQPFNPNDPASLARLTSPVTFSASFGAPILRDMTNGSAEAFIQDDWKPRSNLTLNLGLRYDKQINAFNENLDLSIFPRPIPFIDPASRGDWNNFGPRLGFAWDLRNDGKSVVRGGYGHYFLNFRMSPARGEKVNLRLLNISVNNPSYPDPYQGQDPARFVSTAAPNISILSNDLVNPNAHAFNVGFSRELTPVLGLHLDGLYTRSLQFDKTVNIKAPDPVTRRRPLPEFNRIDQVQSIGEAKYRALLVRLDKRFERRYQYIVSYTLAKIEDNGLTGRVTDVNNPGLDWGPATSDRRHALVVSGAVLLPADVTLGAVWQLRSKMPFDNQAGLDLNGDSFVTDYVPGTSRNQGNRNLDLSLINAWRAANGRAPVSADQFGSNRYNSLDMRVSKSFPMGGNRRLELVALVFNVMGTDNLLTPGLDVTGGRVTNALSDSFGRILTAQPRQQAELGVRFVF